MEEVGEGVTMAYQGKVRRSGKKNKRGISLFTWRSRRQQHFGEK